MSISVDAKASHFFMLNRSTHHITSHRLPERLSVEDIGNRPIARKWVVTTFLRCCASRIATSG